MDSAMRYARSLSNDWLDHQYRQWYYLSNVNRGWAARYAYRLYECVGQVMDERGIARPTDMTFPKAWA